MMEFRTMRPSEFNDWTSLCAKGFDMPPDEFHDHYVTDPNADPEGIFVAVDDGRMVSTVRVFDRRIYIHRTEVKCGCVGEVCTLPEYRGRGLNKHLMELAVGYMLDHDMPISQLFTDSNDYYAKLGWFTVPMRSYTVQLKPENFYMLMSSPTPDDLSQLEQLHIKYASKCDGTIVREGMGEKYWFDWMKRNPGERVLVGMPSRRTAYIDYELKDGTIELREYIGHVPETVLNHLAALLGADKASNLPESLIRNSRFNCIGTAERRDCMYRLITPFCIGKKKIGTSGDLMRMLCDATTFAGDNY